MSRLMKAAEYDRYGPAQALQIREVAHPRIERGEILVRVQASSINPIDTIVRSGKLRLRTGGRFPKRTGIDFSGEVIQPDPGSAEFTGGEGVWGVMPLNVENGFGQGAAAEYISIAATRLAARPESLDPVEAAAVSSVGAVALIALRDKAGLQAHERVLIRGAAGGVGTMAVQLARHIGAYVTVLASAADLVFLKELGADEAYDYRSTTPASLPPFDVILDLVGTDLGKFRRRLTSDGRMYCLAISGIGGLLYIAVSRIYGAKRVHFFSASPMSNTMADLAVLVDNGAIRPVIHSVYALDQIVEAQRSIEAGGGRGKRVLDHDQP